MPSTFARAPTNQVVTQVDFVLGVFLSAEFRYSNDGWFYPIAQGRPLVRVTVNQGWYLMERRRTESSAWMRIVTASVDEFDQEAFESWANNWPLTVQ